ncbi:WYL domain-containing protein [Syntrophomonas curvata]
MYKAKAWYLKAYCVKTSAFRIFKFNRIVKIELLDEKFPPMEYPKAEEPSPKTYNTISLRFPK